MSANMQRRLPKLWRRTRRCSRCTLMVASSVSEQRGMGCVSTHHPLSSEEHPKRAALCTHELSDRMIPPSLFLLTHYHRARCARLSLASLRGEWPAAPLPPLLLSFPPLSLFSLHLFPLLASGCALVALLALSLAALAPRASCVLANPMWCSSPKLWKRTRRCSR